MLYPIQQMPDDSKVWIYQANRQLTLEEIGEMEQLVEGFVEKWEAHKQSVKGFGGIFYKRFIVLMADESVAEVSGCSIDGSVRLIKEIEYTYLPIILQRIESYLLLDVICKKISERDSGILTFTIHDSIITTKGNESIVEEIILHEIESWTGYKPRLELEDLLPLKMAA